MDRTKHKESAEQMPDGLDWESLSAELTANIRVGLAAGECVADASSRKRDRTWAFVRGWDWRPAGAIAGVMVLLTGAWWLNVPPADNVSLRKAVGAIARGGRDRMPQFVRGMEDRAPVLEVNASGGVVRVNGGALTGFQDVLRQRTGTVGV